MLFDFVDTSNQQIVAKNTQHIATITFVFASDDNYVIVLFNLTHDFPRIYLLTLKHFRRKRNDLHKLFSTKLTSYWPEDTSSNRFELGIQQHSCVAIKLYQRTI